MVQSNLKLPEDIAHMAEAAVADGRFRSIEDVVRAGVRAVADPEDDGFNDEERQAAEQMLLERINDGQPLEPFTPADFDQIREHVRTIAERQSAKP